MQSSNGVKILYTRHARMRLNERRIGEDEVEEVLRSPDDEFYDVVTGHLVATKARTRRTGHTLFVVYERADDVIMVISVFDSSSPDKLILRRLGKRWLRVASRR